jgi:hypothetical protein
MAIVEWQDRLYSLETRGRYCIPNGVGEMIMGWSALGEYVENSGVFQRRPRPDGQIFVKMRYYFPPDTPTTKKEAWRYYHGSIIKFWHHLTDIQKKFFRTSGAKVGRSGINRLCTLYAQEKPLELGGNLLGYSMCGNFKTLETI